MKEPARKRNRKKQEEEEERHYVSFGHLTDTLFGLRTFKGARLWLSEENTSLSYPQEIRSGSDRFLEILESPV